MNSRSYIDTIKYSNYFQILCRKLYALMEMAWDPERPGFESQFKLLQSFLGGYLNHTSLGFLNTIAQLPTGLAGNVYNTRLTAWDVGGAQKMVVSLSSQMKNGSSLKETSKAAKNKV